jgi:hypothetical protein
MANFTERKAVWRHDPRRPHQCQDNSYGRSKKAKKISDDKQARYFPASDEQLYGPILDRKISDLVASLDSAV